MLLKDIFDNLYRLHIFAEKKNTYIFSFFSIIAIATYFINDIAISDVNFYMRVSIAILYGIYIVAIIITGLAFFPNTKISKILIKRGRNKKLLKDDNLIFFRDICKYSRDEYINKLQENNFHFEDSKINRDLVDEILIFADIVNYKFAYFKFSCLLTLLAIVQFAVCFIISLFV